MLHFAFVCCAADFAGDRLGTPDSSADCCAGALYFDCFAATGLVNRAAGAAIVFPGSWFTDTFINNWSRAMLGDCFPFTTADFYIMPGMNGFADRTADIPVTGFVICFVDRAAHITVVCFTDRTANSVADIPVAGVINRLAD